ncbi:MAG: VWA domain-containing protein, partial [Methanotrichaceae archaeon]|nr:VWA domain-containing protein [Methanotrichaceae archaeon]
MDQRREKVPQEANCLNRINEAWQKSKENWHWPQLPAPILGESNDGEFPFKNYSISINSDLLVEGSSYIENLFDHLIVHYIFCPRSLEMAGQLALAAVKGLKNHSLARLMVNIFSDIVVDTFRVERSKEDEEKVLLGWRKLANRQLSDIDKAVLGFLSEYWGASLFRYDMPEKDLLLEVFSSGIRNRELWPRQCQQTARILEQFRPGILGRGPIRSMEILNGSADVIPLVALASSLGPTQYDKVLATLGQRGDLKRWYRDQSSLIEILGGGVSRKDMYPSGLVKWRLTDPLNELDLAYSLSISPSLIPGVTTYKREKESSRMADGQGDVPDLLVVLDSSKSMNGHTPGTKTHKATLAAFKACQFAHHQGAEVAAINFSDKYLMQRWTRDLGHVENVLIEYMCARTHIPGQAILELAAERKGCLILCITDTHIQNLYTEWDSIKRTSELGHFVLFCIDPAGRDKYVESSFK